MNKYYVYRKFVIYYIIFSYNCYLILNLASVVFYIYCRLEGQVYAMRKVRDCHFDLRQFDK